MSHLEADDRTPAEQTIESQERELDAMAKAYERLNARCNALYAERDAAEARATYWHQKADHVMQALEDARVEVSRTQSERGAFRALANVHAGVREELEAERAELTRLAEQAMRATTVEEKLMAASVLCARLCRPRGEGSGPSVADDVGLRVTEVES